MTKFLVRLSILLLTPLVLLGLIYGYVWLRSPSSDSGRLVRTADRKMVWVGEMVPVSLHVNGDRFVGGTPTETAAPSVILLLIDRSSSMDSGTGSALESAKSAASYFARVVAGPNQPVGALAFDDGADLASAIGMDGAACADAILDIAPLGGGTDIARALDAGQGYLREAVESGGHPGAIPTMVLLSDGGSDRRPAIEAASKAKADGTRIVTIGLGSQVDEELLLELASTPADFHYTMDAGSLGDVYMNIASDMAPVIGHGVSLSEKFHYGAFSLESPPPGFRVEQDLERGRLTLQLPVLFAQRVDFPYLLRARRIGLFGLALDRAELSLAPDPRQPDQTISIVSNLTPPVAVISPLLLILFWLPAFGYVVWRAAHALKSKPPEPEIQPIRTPLKVPPRLALVARPEIEARSAQPTLFVGLGRRGGETIREVAGQLSRDRYLQGVAEPPFRFLQIDGRSEGVEPLADSRFPMAKAQLPRTVAPLVQKLRAAPTLPEHLDWLPPDLLAEAGNAEMDLSAGTRGSRWPARLALFDALERDDDGFFGPWDEALDWLQERGRARIVLVGSMESGLGSLLNDFSYLLYSAIPAHQRSEFPVYALALADIPASHPHSAANQKSFLEELDRYLAATHMPQRMNYRAEANPDRPYLRDELREPVYSGFFILQSTTRNREEVDWKFLSQVGAVGHCLTEKSMVSRLQSHLEAVRSLDQDYQARKLEGVVHSVAAFLIRFPAAEMIERLSCRFIREILGEERLVGVGLSEDGRSLRPVPTPPEALQEAIDLWPALEAAQLGAPSSLGARLYKAFCRVCAAQRPAGLRSALKSELGKSTPPGKETFVAEMEAFAKGWFDHFLNGDPTWDDSRTAAWRRHRIAALHGVLLRLLEFGEVALRNEPGRDSQPKPPAQTSVPLSLGELLECIDKFHRGWRDHARRWLAVLVGPEVLGSDFEGGDVPDWGLYRRANDRYQELGKRLMEENEQPWQIVLGDEDGNTRLSEDSLYRRQFAPFLEEERGFLLRWVWQVQTGAESTSEALKLRLVTDGDETHSADAEGVARLYARLTEVAESRCRILDSVTILDKLRSDGGQLDLTPLANLLAREAEQGGLRLNRQHPGGDQIQRRVLALVPDWKAPELDLFEGALKRIVDAETEVVRQLDLYAVRLLVVDSVIPLGAVRLSEFPEASQARPAELPFVFPPEQEGERWRRRVEQRLGIVPCPEFHPLTRLLLAAPMGLGDWAGLLSEESVRPESMGRKDVLVIDDGLTRRQIVEDRQGVSLVWGLLNLAYGVFGSVEAGNVLRRWRSRSSSERITRLAAAGATMRDAAERGGDQTEREILGQVALLVELEGALEKQRHEEAGG